MKETERQVHRLLVELVEVNRDAEHVYALAAQGCETEALQRFCEETSRQRGTFAGELEGELRLLGDEALATGTLNGAVRRGWTTLRAVVSAREEEAVLRECEREEAVTRAAYERALKAYMPPGLTGTVQRQYALIRQVEDQFRSLLQITRFS